MNKTLPNLDQLRDEIDSIDQQIQECIVQRAKCAQAVAKVKRSVDQSAVFYRPEREAKILKQVQMRDCGPLKDKEMARLFREIMSSCLALEQPVKVAYLGPEGTFTQKAALKHFGHACHLHPLNAIDEIFREVESGAVDYGVVPVENSSEGIVNHTLDSFMDSPLQICGEVVLRIHHHLLVSDNTQKDRITRIYAHAQSLAQCRKWLDANFLNVERIPLNSNAEAAKRVKHEWNAAAIASDMACELYGLEKLAEKIEDEPSNSTRFLIIGSESIPASGCDRTSVILSAKNRPGVLYDLLKPFQSAKLDLTRIESRPSRSGMWNYVFFVDFKGHINDPNVAKTLEEVSASAVQLKLLGSYPEGVL